MPFMKDGKRNYHAELEWEKSHGKKRQNDRVKRNAARREMMAEGKAKKGDGRQVDHIQALLYGGSNAKSNLRVVSSRTNLEKEAKRKKDASGKK